MEDPRLSAEFVTIVHRKDGLNNGACITMQASGTAEDEDGYMVFYGTLALGQPDSLKDGIRGEEIRIATDREISTFRHRRRTHLAKIVKDFCQACEHAPCECLD